VLVVMTGLPGTGKSAVAEAVARALPAPVFSVDPLEAVLLRAGIDREHRSDYAAYDLAAALAESQLRLGQSAVVDAVNALERLRRWFLGLAEPVGAPAVLIETICSDPLLHRARFENRDGAIDGWVYEPTWQDVERRKLEYEPSSLERLVLDAVEPREENARTAIEYVKMHR
jgi:predicted kinase